MTQIAVTSFAHSTVRLEQGDQALVIDPGAFAPAEAFADVTAFLITHDHQDHVDVPRVVAALTANPESRAWVSADVATQLTEAGAPADRVSAVTGGESFTAAGLPVLALGGEHAEIHRSLPSSPNIAFLIDNRVLHPGDAFPAVPDGVTVDVLFLPVSGPWMRFADAVDYVDTLRPRVIVPIHDGDLIDAGRALTDQMSALFPGDGKYERLPVGERTFL
ncbi:MBL fold metallo-hydrolase [Nocardia neocaledoniensis]|uniref:MBL fold metallo-hydrolase n=1 Tax=Nocardia neocaledoniensis TaxID=236511 RepID=UPI00245812BD|nr:MBL fold metallo-hydrolase [Nocardia neocaledoniensis]